MRAATRRDFCNEDFVINMEVEAEEDTHNRVCEDCGETVSKKSWKRHQLRKHDTRIFQYEECPHQGIEKEKFQNHKVCDFNHSSNIHGFEGSF